MSYPFVQARHHGGSGNVPPTRVVIHATVSPTVAGGALSIAKYFGSTARDASAHYVVDPQTIYQCLTENTIGYHAPPNAHSIGIELCDPQTGSPARWQDTAHQAMLMRAAALTRDICDRYGIPIVKLSPADLLAGKRGICGHVDVTNAWHQTTHDDPGVGFPWAQFIALVQANAPINQEDALPSVDEVVTGLLSAQIGRSGLTVAQCLQRASVATSVDVNAIATAVAAKLGGSADVAAIEAALREVFADAGQA